MLYLVVYASYFYKSTIDELKKFARFRIIKRFVNSMLIESDDTGIVKKLKRARPIFVYNAVGLFARRKINEKNYLASVHEALLRSGIDKQVPFRIECIDLNSKRGYSAKDLEVYSGSILEKNGFRISLSGPKRLAYAVIADMNCYAGSDKLGNMLHPFIDPFRYYSKKYKASISRAELKLIQAFDEFHIKNGGIAIDLGAAPGGWSKVLVDKGFRVVAIDNGPLDYGGLKKAGIRVIVAKNGGSGSRPQILHIRTGYRQAHKRIKKLRADMLLDDMNLHPLESAGAVLDFRKFLGKGSELLMTVKCPTRKVNGYIEIARSALAANFRIKGAKALPSNRQEVMLYAIYSGAP